jgi:hypothetical protein
VTPVGALLLLAGMCAPPLFFVDLLGYPPASGTAAAREADGSVDVEAGELVSEGETTGPPWASDVRTLRSHSAWRVGVCDVPDRAGRPRRVARLTPGLPATS